jgi:2-iminobutanoate/2-iminopropanoate deaminase
MSVERIFPAKLPVPKGHYSPAVVHQGVVYVSGQLPIYPDGRVESGEIEAQLRVCLENIRTILQAAGSDLSHVLKVNIFVTDVALWPRINAVYADFFGSHKPARIVVPVQTLNYGAQVEVDCIAAVI